jgi:hypothetical protein
LDIVNLAVLGIRIGGLNQQLPSLLLLAMTFRENNGSNYRSQNCFPLLFVGGIVTANLRAIDK